MVFKDDSDDDSGDDPTGLTPVRRSVAKSGEIAEWPTDGGAITTVEVRDTDDNPHGLLIEWKSDSHAAWLWAESGSYSAPRD